MEQNANAPLAEENRRLREENKELLFALTGLVESSCQSACALPPWTHVEGCDRKHALERAREVISEVTGAKEEPAG